MDRETLLSNPRDGMDALARLFTWAENEAPDTGGDVWRLFLDLTGYSVEHFGDTVNPPQYRAGYLELSLLADALAVYAGRPGDVKDYALELELSE